jgi:hypothetical protein
VRFVVEVMEVSRWEEGVVVGDDLADSGASRWRQAVAERGVFAGKDDRGLGPGGGICVLGKHGNEGGQGQSECWDARQ